MKPKRRPAVPPRPSPRDQIAMPASDVTYPCGRGDVGCGVVSRRKRRQTTDAAAVAEIENRDPLTAQNFRSTRRPMATTKMIALATTIAVTSISHSAHVYVEASTVGYPGTVPSTSLAGHLADRHHLADRSYGPYSSPPDDSDGGMSSSDDVFDEDYSDDSSEFEDLPTETRSIIGEEEEEEKKQENKPQHAQKKNNESSVMRVRAGGAANNDDAGPSADRIAGDGSASAGLSDNDRESAPSKTNNGEKSAGESNQSAKSDAAVTTAASSESGQSQPLKTLKKLQAMLDDSDYATATASSSSSRSNKNAVKPAIDIKAGPSGGSAKIALDESMAVAEVAAKDNNQNAGLKQMANTVATTTKATATTNAPPPPPAAQVPSSQQQTEQSAASEKLWTSKDRSKYKKQKRLRQERERREKEQLEEQRRKWQQMALSDDDDDATDGMDATTEDDGLGYTLPNLPVYLSDSEGNSDELEFLDTDDDFVSTASQFQQRQNMQPALKADQDRSQVPNNQLVPQQRQQQPQSSQQHQALAQVVQGNPYHQYQPYPYQYPQQSGAPPPQQQQQQQQGQYQYPHAPPMNYPYAFPGTYGSTPSNVPDPYSQQQQQQHQYAQQYAAWAAAAAASSGTPYPPPPPPSQPQQGGVPPPPPMGTDQNYPPRPYQQSPYGPGGFVPQPYAAPRTPTSNTPTTASQTSARNKASVKNRGNPSAHVQGQPQSQEGAVAVPPVPHSVPFMPPVVHGGQPVETWHVEYGKGVSLAEAGANISFDSIQKLVFVFVGVMLMSYCAVSPRTLPIVEYNLRFKENIQIASLVIIAPLITSISVFDAKESDINQVISTFTSSFTLGYIMSFMLEVIWTTVLRLGVFLIWEPSIFELTPTVPTIILPWVLRENKYRPKRITLFAADFATSCVAAPIIEEYVKLKIVQLSCRLPRNYKRVKKRPSPRSSTSSSKKGKKKKKKRQVLERIVRGPGETDVTNVNIYVTKMLAASLGLKLCDSVRRILMYTKRTDASKSFYSFARGIFPIHELCGTMTALELAKRDILGVDLPLWRILLPAVFIHGMANFRGMKPIFKWNSSTPWSEMQLSPWNVADDSTLGQMVNKGFAKLMWLIILGRVLGYCIKNYYLVGRQAVKRTTTYAGKQAAFSAELAAADYLKKTKKD